MDKKHLKISALSYANTFPFVYALRHKLEGRVGDLKYEVPAVSAERFKNHEVDVALVPVASLLELADYKIITDFCIGSFGEVKTVALFSNRPLNKINKIYLDKESLTSVNLVKILAKEFWKINPQWESVPDDFVLQETDAMVLIGDKTFSLRNKYPYFYDLSLEWKKFTGLPFVFAVWVARNYVTKEIVDELNEVLSFGLENIDKLYDEFDLSISKNEFEEYLTHFIDYNLDSSKRLAIDMFLGLLKS